MLTTLGILQVQSKDCGQDAIERLSSFACRSLGGKSLLEWIVRRVTDAQHLDGVIVVIGKEACSHRISSLVPLDVPVFTGEDASPLDHLAAALCEFPADSIVRVTLDNPFIDPALIDRLIITARANPGCDYISYCLGNGQPAVLSQVGLFAEWCRAEAIFKAHREATRDADRWEVTRYLYSHPERFQIRLLQVPPQLDRNDVRLTIHGEEDWEHALTIFEALGPECLDWRRIAGLLDQQPAIRQRMAVLNRASESSG